MNLQQNLQKRLKEKGMLLTSHAVISYPDFDLMYESINEMSKAGIDVIELQIPFSDPQADGSYLTHANQVSVQNGVTVEQAFEVAEKVCADYSDIHFIFMTYLNIVYQYGFDAFIKRASNVGIKALILPDLPIEESDEYFEACKKYSVDPILMVTPVTSDDCMKKIAEKVQGFLYCQARLGTTGKQTKFDQETIDYIHLCRQITDLPIAMGFGIQQKEDVDFLKGKVDMVICCTAAMKVLEEKGAKSMGEFLEELRG